MSLYAAFDLHASNSYLGILDQDGARIRKGRLRNEPERVLEALKPHQEKIAGVVVESTYNWYWLVDTLMDAGYTVHLANPGAIQQYKGLKHSDDQHDAFWLEEMLRLGILPKGYIYPKEDRPIRDLLRKRAHLVRLRTSLVISLQNIISRNYGIRVKGVVLQTVKPAPAMSLLQEDEDLCLSGKVSKECIDFMNLRIRQLERRAERKMDLRPSYQALLGIPGIGKILGLTIMLETGDIGRFEAVGNYASYCRKVPSIWTSDGKRKGKGNLKNGNKYLAWAYSEAAEMGRRYDERMAAYFNRKTQRTNRMVAHAALAHKIARAAYYVMRDQVPFDTAKLFR